MKLFSKIALIILAFSISTVNLLADAQVQIIHNSSDPVAAVVDIYVNGQKLPQLDNFSYRSATPYVPLPAGIDIVVTVANSSSTDVMDGVIKTFNLGKLEDNKEYIIVANGVVGTGFNAGEMGRDIDFDLIVRPGKRYAGKTNQIDVSVFHGVTDAGKVDVYIAKTGEEYSDVPQVLNLNYGESSDFLSLDAGFYNIKLTATSNKDLIIGEYSAPLTTASGLGAIVMASGFITPEDENGGVNATTYGFGLLAVAPLGLVIPIPQLDFASVQIIHNSSDPSAQVVDIYINGLKLIEDLQFRKATAFLPVVADETVNISINSSSSNGINDGVIKTFQLPALEANAEYVVFANGVIGNGFIEGEAGRDISFQLFAGAAKTKNNTNQTLDINVFHGSTDATPVDIYTEINGNPLVENLNYGEFSGLINVASNDYLLTVTIAGNKELVAGIYEASLSAPIGNITLFASGFINANEQQDGLDEEIYGIGLFAALSTGEVIELELFEEGEEDMAMVQIIHNSADPKLSEVDIYVNGELVLDNFAFRNATQYLPFMANTEYEISINLATSTSVEDSQMSLVTLPMLEGDTEYNLIANGVIGNGFNSGADGRDIAFNLFIIDAMSESFDESVVTINAFHGATDAPAIDVYNNDGNDLVIENLDYTNDIGLTPFDAFDVDLKLTAYGITPQSVIGIYKAPLSMFLGESILIMTSGFLTPEDEQGGSSEQEFGVYAVTVNGEVIKLDLFNSVNRYLSNNSKLYPNPSSNQIEIELEGAVSSSYKIYNNKSDLLLENNTTETNRLSIDLNTLTNGNYFVVIETNKGQVFKKFIVNK